MRNVPGYQTTSILHEGPRFLTYRGVRASDRAPVLLKMAAAEYPSVEDTARLRHEHRLCSALSLPGILAPHALESYQGRLVLVQEDFGGLPLSAFAHGAIDIDALLRLAIQIADTLGELHKQRIVHKDIHAGSIYFEPRTGAAKLTNFGVASQPLRQSQAEFSPASVEGLLAYMSPEQTGRMNRAIDHRSDFYSLGICLYERLVGRLPFASTDPMELVHSHIARRPAPPHTVSATAPEGLSRMVMKLLAKTAEERYQTGRGLRRDLERCLEQWRSGGGVAPFELGRDDTASTLQPPQKLYGRGAEREALLAAFERASEGSSEMVVVEGYAGIGKSTLVHEIQKPVVERRGYFISGKFDQLERELPYSSLLQAFQSLARQVLTEDEARVARWREQLREALGGVGQVIIDLIPEVGVIMGPQSPVPALGPAESQNRLRLAFHQFIGVFAQKEHPLAVFLDDLQWADSASLSLLQDMMLERHNQYILLIGAYRDNEVEADHALSLLLEKLEKAGKPLTRLSLRPLSPAELTGLLSDTLARPEARVAPLADLLHGKTEGNPFFVRELLKELHDAGLLVFNPEASVDRPDEDPWTWRIEDIRAAPVADNVVNLMIRKIQKLRPETEEMVKLAACLGDRFDLNLVALAGDKTPGEAAALLWEAVDEGLIMPEGSAYLLLQDAGPEDAAALEDVRVPYAFVHDRVRQAAYSLLDARRREEIHARVGRLMLRRYGAERREESLFEMVSHLNAGAAHVVDAEERRELASLNLSAGRRAKASSAYEAALRFLIAGTALLDEDAWTTDYDRMFALQLQRAECEYLTARLTEAGRRFDTLKERARTRMDRVTLHTTHMTLLLHLGEQDKAIDAGLTALRLLGFELPAEPSAAQVGLELAKVQWGLAGKSVESLAALPDRMNPETRAAMRLLTNLWFPVYLQKREKLVALLMLKTVHLSLLYGNTSTSSFGYAFYGVIQSSMFRRPRAGAAFGKLALDLTRRFDDPAVTSKTLFIIACFLSHFTTRARASIDHLEQGVKCGLEAGDIIQAGFCANVRLTMMSLLGTPLPEIALEARRLLDFGVRIGAPGTIQNAKAVQRWSSLLREAEPSAVSDAEFVCDLTGRVQGPDTFYALHLQAAYLLDRYDLAVAMAETLLREHPHYIGPSLYAAAYHAFFHALAVAAAYPTAPRSKRKSHLEVLKRARSTLKRWAVHSPQTASFKHALVEAEAARLEGDAARASKLYDQAIAQAQEHGFVQHAALANERAARFYRARGQNRVAQGYLEEARYLYLSWGATTKVAHLDQQHGDLLARPAGRSAEKHPSEQIEIPHSMRLDLTSVFKASQILSGALVLSELLRQVMQIVVENAGAQRGFLILIDGERLVVEAAGATDQAEVVVLQSMPVERCPDLALSVVHYVHRTMRDVVLDDASQEGLFTRDPYVLRQQPKSILCTPLGRQGQLGLLYLENNLTTGAFTPERIEVLRLLSSQVAISIENARLYTNLEQKVAQRTDELRQKNLDLEDTLKHLRAAQTQLVHQEKLAALGKLTAGIAHEIKNPLNFINNFSELASELCDELLDDAADPELRVAEVSETLNDLRTSTQKILEHGKRADGIVRSMLELSRVRTGERKPVELNALIEEYVKLSLPGLRGLGDEPEVHLQRDYDEAVGLVELVAPEIGQVVLNLLSNALYAVRQRRIAEGRSYVPRVTVRTRSRGNLVEICVEDNGPGVPREHRDKLFEPFFTTKPAGQGTGLGLSLSYDIVVQGHRGQMTVESEERRSTTFCISLPRVSAYGEAARGPR
ncbi:trifunctional serine/threonine-protein kinase/ATP-binding protein/sensor histidine kinase [Sorangium sp. So ce406]|uniref:trifunctional serine/threonine-protein kinase/ATP-binding protein/sensor histidine kinase n=1 Tax=Sorangium sp. So ce406 TaxID=3133311 RepID=UPI003F5C749B